MSTEFRTEGYLAENEGNIQFFADFRQIPLSVTRLVSTAVGVLGPFLI